MAGDQAPLAPAHAYSVMENILPPEWFFHPPPEHGVELEVVGKDGVPTLWAMAALDAEAVISSLRTIRAPVSVMPRRY